MNAHREELPADSSPPVASSRMSLGPLSEDMRARLSRVVGEAKAKTLMSETLKRMGLQQVATPQDMFNVASALETHGGSVAVVAAALKMRALLRGATPG